MRYNPFTEVVHIAGKKNAVMQWVKWLLLLLLLWLLLWLLVLL